MELANTVSEDVKMCFKTMGIWKFYLLDRMFWAVDKIFKTIVVSHLKKKKN